MGLGEKMNDRIAEFLQFLLLTNQERVKVAEEALRTQTKIAAMDDDVCTLAHELGLTRHVPTANPQISVTEITDAGRAYLAKRLS